MRRGLALIVLAGCHVVPAPEPDPPRPHPIQIESVAPCQGEHTRTTDGWTVELMDPEPKPGLDQIVYRSGPGWQWQVATVTQPLRGATSGHFDEGILPFWTAVDDDGSLIVRGSWHGNPDQANNIGIGLYRIDDGRAKPLVDPATVIPGRSEHFNEIGLPAVERGVVAFWGGHGPHDSGVYMVRGAAVSALSPSVPGTGTPAIHGGWIAFVGESSGQRGVFLWTERAGVSGPIIGGEHVLDVAVGDHVVFAGMQGSIVAWSAGVDWPAADASWFSTPGGEPLRLAPRPVARGDAVAFIVGGATRSEAWISHGCMLERAAATGDPIGSHTIKGIADLQRDAFTPSGDLLLVVVLEDGTVRSARARRTPRLT